MPTTRNRQSAAYKLLQDQLRARIEAGDWPVGAMIPARGDLAVMYNVAAKTVQRAVAALVDDGVLRTVQRRGTFVAGTGGRRSAGGSPVGSARAATLAMIVAPDEYMREGSAGGSWVVATMEAIERTFAEEGRGITRFYGVGREPGMHASAGAALRAATADDVDAAVVINLTSYEGWLRQTLVARDRSKLPVALAWGTELRTALPHVVMDQWMNGHQAASHLLDVGYRKIAFLAPRSAQWLNKRVEGARASAKERGLSSREFVVAALRSKRELAAYRNGDDCDVLMALLLKRALGALQRGKVDRPGALICPSDRDALVAMRVMAELGLKPGGDVGVIGFDDDPRARLAGLTSLRPPLEDLGATTARLVASMLRGGRPAVETRLSSTLVPRSSTVRQ